MNPDTTLRTADLLSACASTMLNRTNKLVNGCSCGWGYDNVNDNVNGHDHGTQCSP